MGNDRFGVAMIHPSAIVNPQSWYYTNLQDSRVDGEGDFKQLISDNINGEITNTNPTSAKLMISTTTGYRESEIEMSHRKAKVQRYLMSATDWRNVESTAYVKFLDGIGEDGYFAMDCRSGKHAQGRPCEGTYYSMQFSPGGMIRSERKHWHPNGVVRFGGESILGDIEGQRVGLKSIVYNGGLGVVLEAHVDINGNNKWRKMYDYNDVGLGNEFFKCGSYNTRVISWGGPLINFRCENIPAESIVIDSLSIREIRTPSRPVFGGNIDAGFIEFKMPLLPTGPLFPSTRDEFEPDLWEDD